MRSILRHLPVVGLVLALTACTGTPLPAPSEEPAPSAGALVAALDLLPLSGKSDMQSISIADQSALAEGLGQEVPRDEDGRRGWRERTLPPSADFTVFMPMLLDSPKAPASLWSGNLVAEIREGRDTTIVALDVPEGGDVPLDGKTTTVPAGPFDATMARRGRDVILATNPDYVTPWLEDKVSGETAASVPEFVALAEALQAEGAQTIRMNSYPASRTLRLTHLALGASTDKSGTTEFIAVSTASEADTEQVRAHFEEYVKNGEFGIAEAQPFKELASDARVQVFDRVVVLAYTPKEVGKVLRDYPETMTCPTCG